MYITKSTKVLKCCAILQINADQRFSDVTEDHSTADNAMVYTYHYLHPAEVPTQCYMVVTHFDFPDSEGQEDAYGLDDGLVAKQHGQPGSPIARLTEMHKVLHSHTI